MNEKKRMYDELSRTLTDYESNNANEKDLYNMLVDIQNSWEAMITSYTLEKNYYKHNENNILM